MKNWEWMNEGTEEPKTYNEQVVEEYTDQLLDLVDHYADPGDLKSALEHFDVCLLFKNVENWLNSERKEG